jgi:hypothetical protein
MSLNLNYVSYNPKSYVLRGEMTKEFKKELIGKLLGKTIWNVKLNGGPGLLVGINDVNKKVLDSIATYVESKPENSSEEAGKLSEEKIDENLHKEENLQINQMNGDSFGKVINKDGNSQIIHSLKTGNPNFAQKQIPRPESFEKTELPPRRGLEDRRRQEDNDRDDDDVRPVRRENKKYLRPKKYESSSESSDSSSESSDSEVEIRRSKRGSKKASIRRKLTPKKKSKYDSESESESDSESDYRSKKSRSRGSKRGSNKGSKKPKSRRYVSDSDNSDSSEEERIQKTIRKKGSNAVDNPKVEISSLDIDSDREDVISLTRRLRYLINKVEKL